MTSSGIYVTPEIAHVICGGELPSGEPCDFEEERFDVNIDREPRTPVMFWECPTCGHQNEQDAPDGDPDDDYLNSFWH